MHKTQQQLFYAAERRSAAINDAFLMAIKDGLTRRELVSLVARRPVVWERFSNWLDKLPA